MRHFFGSKPRYLQRKSIFFIRIFFWWKEIPRTPRYRDFRRLRMHSDKTDWTSFHRPPPSGSFSNNHPHNMLEKLRTATIWLSSAELYMIWEIFRLDAAAALALVGIFSGGARPRKSQVLQFQVCAHRSWKPEVKRLIYLRERFSYLWHQLENFCVTFCWFSKGLVKSSMNVHWWFDQTLTKSLKNHPKNPPSWCLSKRTVL